MTTSITTRPAAGILQRVGALSLFAWPAMHFAGFVTGPPGKTHAPDVFREHATQVQVSGVLLHWSAILIVPVMLTLAYLLHDRMPRFAVIAGLLGALGAINGASLLLADFYDLALAFSVPDAQAVAITDLAYGYGGVVYGFLLPGFLIHPALLALLIALVRAGRARWWQPVLLVIGLALPFFTADRPTFVQATGALFIGAALVPLGVRLLRSPMSAAFPMPVASTPLASMPVASAQAASTPVGSTPAASMPAPSMPAPSMPAASKPEK